MTRAGFVRRLGRVGALVAIAVLLVEGVLQGAALVIHLAGRRPDAGWSSEGLRLLALGDSNTYGIYLDEEDSYPSQLQALWNEDPGSSGPIEVLNFGYPGNSTDAILADYRRTLTVLEPDVVLFLAGANDYWARPVDRTETGEKRFSTVSFLARYSRLYRLWQIAQGAGESGAPESMTAPNFRDPSVRLEIERRGITDWLRDNGEEGRAFVSETRRHGGETFAFGFRAGDAPVPRDETERRLDANLDELHAISNTFATVVLTLTYPSNAGLYRLANGAIRRAARAGGWNVIDLAAVFRERCAGDPACPRFLLPDGHPTARGYALVAEVLRDEIRAGLASGTILPSR